MKAHIHHYFKINVPKEFFHIKIADRLGLFDIVVTEWIAYRHPWSLTLKVKLFISKFEGQIDEQNKLLP